MSRSPSFPPLGNSLAYTLLVGIALLDTGLLWLLFREPVTIFTFLWGLLLLVSLPALILIVYSSAGSSTWRYHTARNNPGEGLPSTRLTFLSWPIWQDRLAHIIVATAASLNGLLFAYLCAIYGRLPRLIPLHFDEHGFADRVEAPASLFVLPLVGLIAWLVNGALGWYFYHWRDEQPLAFIMWGATILVQLATWAAVLGLLA